MTGRSNPWVLIHMTSDICGNVTTQSGAIRCVAATREECEDAHGRYFERPRCGHHAFRICRWSDLSPAEKGRAARWLARREKATP